MSGWELPAILLVLVLSLLGVAIHYVKKTGGQGREIKGLKLAARKAKAAGAVASRAWKSGRDLVRERLRHRSDRDT